jgi:hypothetical protein
MPYRKTLDQTANTRGSRSGKTRQIPCKTLAKSLQNTGGGISRLPETPANPRATKNGHCPNRAMTAFLVSKSAEKTLSSVLR